MVKKTQAEIEELFAAYLDRDEEILWLGNNQLIWGFGQFIGDIGENSRQFLRIFIVFMIVAFLIFLGIWGFWVGLPYLSIGILLIPYVIAESKKLVAYISDIPRRLRGLSPYICYAITNERVLIAEQGEMDSYKLMSVTDVVLEKPSRGYVNLSAYYRTKLKAELPEPIFQLKGISEEDAQAASEILQQAREQFWVSEREMGT